MNQRAALYARVSSTRQEKEQTIASQLAALDAAASLAGVRITEEHRYVDDGYSGSALGRPALDRLRDAAADGMLDVVFVHCPDRLARNFVHQQILIEELNKRGVEVHFVERPIGERAEDRLLVQMQGVIAEYERAKIVERTRRGRLHKIKAGQLLGLSCAYGYAIVRTAQTPGGMLVIDEVQAQHVRSMFRWARDEGLSLAAIARRLNEQGVRPPQATHWGISSVYRMLRNPLYIGLACYGKSESVEPRKPAKEYRKAIKSSRSMRPRELWHEQRVPALVDESTFREVGDGLTRNRRLASRNVRHDYLLRGLVTCGHCGLRMTATYTNVGGKYAYFYYTCAGRKQPEETCRLTRCTAPSVRSDQLDATAWEALTSWLKSPQMLREQVSAWKDSRQSSTQLAQEATRLNKVLRQLDVQIGRLLDAYQTGAIDIDELKARRERLDAHRDAARSQQQRLRAEEQSRGRADRVAEDICVFASTLGAGIENLDFEGRQRLVRLLIERVVLKEDVVSIEHVVPLSGRFLPVASTPPSTAVR